MSEKYGDPSVASKKGLNEDAEVEGHRFEDAGEDMPGKKGFTEDMPGKKGLTEDDGPEVEGHMLKLGTVEKKYKKG